jgi:DNA-binding transcriptional MerR regulator
MFKIGEFSAMNRITVKTLRHYDELGLLRPAHIDEITGYRFYTTDQLFDIQKIIHLKTIGFSLDEIAQVTKKEVSSEEWISKLQKKKKEVSNIIESEKMKLKQLQTYLSTLKKEKHMKYHVTMKKIPEVNVVSLRKVIKNYDELFTLYPSCGPLMEEAGVVCLNPEYCFTVFHDGEYRKTDIDVELCQAIKSYRKKVAGLTFKTIPEVQQAACIFHKGPYTTIGQTYAVLTKWIKDNGFKLSGPMRESAIDGIWNKDNPKDWLTEIQAPVQKKDR